MASKKTIIHEFDPCIYPRLLWVVKGGELDEIRKTLEFAELDEDNDVCGAVTIAAYNNEEKRGGFLVWFPKPSDMTKRGDWIAHEAAHVALEIYDYVGAEAKARDSEPFAYLVGWVFKCMDTVRKFKEEKHGCEGGESNHNQEDKLEEARKEEKEDARR